MELLPLLCLCLLTRSGVTSAQLNGPTVITVEGGADAVLPCSLSTKENIESKLFDWRKVAQKDDGLKEVFLYDGGIHYNNGQDGQSEEFKERVSHFPEELEHGNASIIIRNTKISDSGNYTCDFPRLQPPQIFHIQLVVGVSLEPSVTSLEVTKNWARLQCKVKGASPKPEVEWQDSDGKRLPAEERPVSNPGGPDDIILLTTVTKTGNYRCVVTQREFNHQTTSQIHVYIQGPTVITVKGAEVMLPCSLSTKEKIEFKLFEWRKIAQKDDGLKEVFLYNGGQHYNNGFDGQSEEFKGRVSHFQGELEHGNASIIIRNTTISDSGEYTCEFPNLEPPQTFYIELVVVGLAPKPSITSLKETKVWSLLQCEVHGNPKPEVEWQDSAGNKLPAEESQVTEKSGLFYITLNTTVTKRGRYRCNATQETISHQVYAETDVYISGPPLIVVEGSDVVLPCSLSTKENIEFKLFDWRKVAQKDDGLKEVFMYDGGIHYNNGLDGQSVKFKGRVSHFQDELKYGNASIIIRNTTISDSGVYTCYFPRLQPPQTFYIELVVGAAPEPFVTTHHTNYGVLLQCKVHGTPKPRVEWQDSAGNILPAEEPQVSERGGHFYITLNATVTETDDYRCVATQETISHQISTRIYVNGSPTRWTVGLVLLALLALVAVVAVVALVVLAVLVYKRCNPLKHNKDEEYEDVQNPSKSHGSPPEPNALHPFMMEERL